MLVLVAVEGKMEGGVNLLELRRIYFGSVFHHLGFRHFFFAIISLFMCCAVGTENFCYACGQ